MKKSQVSIFIFIGILILIISSFFIYLNNQKLKPSFENADLPYQRIAIKNFVDSCLKNSALDALFFVASKGGYYENPKQGVDYLFNTVPYYFYLNENTTPALGFVEESISKYIENDLPFCINDFADFTSVQVTSENIKAETEIAKDKVIFNLNYPITINKGNSKAHLTNFQTELPVRFADLYNTGLKITEFQMEDNENICLSCLLDVIIKNNVSIKFENYNEDTILFKVILNDSSINERIFELVFANKYMVR